VQCVCQNGCVADAGESEVATVASHPIGRVWLAEKVAVVSEDVMLHCDRLVLHGRRFELEVVSLCVID
jgi:hypothetical protein